ADYKPHPYLARLHFINSLLEQPGHIFHSPPISCQPPFLIVSLCVYVRVCVCVCVCVRVCVCRRKSQQAERVESLNLQHCDSGDEKHIPCQQNLNLQPSG